MLKPSESETASLDTKGSLFLQVSYTQLRSFHAVAVTGGFTAASKVLHVGQPTITALDGPWTVPYTHLTLPTILLV